MATRTFKVPIFDVSVSVVVTHDIPAAYKKMFGYVIEKTPMACLGYEGNKFGLFLEPKAKLEHHIIAHELFHLTHRILERCEMNFDAAHHEMGAYLNEWLHETVHEILNLH